MEFHQDDLPRSPAQWEKAQRNLEAQTIPALGKLNSASEIKRPQFLLLRALWDVKLQHEFKRRDWLDEKCIAEAISFLHDKHPDWKIYLESFTQEIKLEQRPFSSLGAFTLVKYSQLEVMITNAENSSGSVVVSPRKTRSMTAIEEAQNATPSRPPANPQKFLNAKNEDDDSDEDYLQDETAISMLSRLSPARKGEQRVLYPPTEDEQIVNAALLNFLTVVVIAQPHACLRWCLARKQLKFACHDEEYGAAEYEARTDGYLRGQNHSTAYAIVEVKPYLRADKPHTRWQETAQMAAWIREDPSPHEGKFQRLLVSQDRHEIYLTFARFSSRYVKYLKEGIKEGEPFLLMHEFGPFDIGHMGHMKKLGETILAFTLQMSSLDGGRFDEEDSGAPGRPASAMSSDPENLASSLSKLNTSETPRTPTSKQPQRSIPRRSLIPRPNLSQSTDDYSKRRRE